MFNVFRTKPAEEIAVVETTPTLYNVGKTKYTIHLKNGDKSSYVYTGFCYVRTLFGVKEVIVRDSKHLFELFLKKSKSGFILFEIKKDEDVYVPVSNVDHVSSVTEEFLAPPTY